MVFYYEQKLLQIIAVKKLLQKSLSRVKSQRYELREEK